MKLLTKALLKRFESIGNQASESDPMVIAKFFNPSGAGTWYATEFDPETGIFFGYVTGLAFDEWGTFSLYEFESTRLPPFGLKIERDLHYSECRFSVLMDKTRQYQS